DRHRTALGRLLHQPRELPRAAHALAVIVDDDVAGLEAGLFRRAVGVHFIDLHAGRCALHVDVADHRPELAPPPPRALTARSRRGATWIRVCALRPETMATITAASPR